MNEIEAAWVAGLFEGEGSISFKATSTVTLGLSSTDEDVITKLQSIVGGTIYHYTNRPERKPVWTWYLGERDKVAELLTAMLPHLGSRRSAKAQDALERLRLNKGHQRNWTHCIRGHELPASRRCNKCQKVRSETLSVR